MVSVHRPTPEQLQAAHGKCVPDIIRPRLKVVFCGINPGLYSAAVGHHFARPGNRFWPALHLGGFTPQVLTAFEEGELLEAGYGITNVVERATAGADELTKEELREGGKKLRKKIERYRPRVLAVLGVGAYREAFGDKEATVGRQEEKIGGTRLWVLPNPSGLNAHYLLEDLGKLFGELRRAVDKEC
jgi:TDG/mug DNA glycosylase family protein